MKAPKEELVPLRVSEWPMERLLWERVNKADLGRLAIISFEIDWRDNQESMMEVC